MAGERNDNIHNYEVHEEIGRGATSVVYRATCSKGRLRHRTVALKKIPMDTPTPRADLPHTASLHQSLFHPSVVSLVSVFSTSSAQYHVLEYCSNGTLHAFLHSRRPPVLTEGELRGVLKSIVAALVYLHKQRVIHRDIKPSNVLLTEDFRVKLSDFGLSIQLPSEHATATTFCGSPNYVSPEMVAQKRYGFATDIWSLGALAVTCLTGVPAFEAPTTAQIFANITRGVYALPENISFEARDLVSGLLQLNPSHRTPLHRILSHPFFNPSLPVQSLTQNPTASSSDHPSEKPPSFNHLKAYKYPTLLSKTPLAPRDTESAIEPRLARRNFSSDTWKPKPSPAHIQDHLRWPPGSSTGRRIVSAPEFCYTPTSTFSSLRQELNTANPTKTETLAAKKKSTIPADSRAALATPPLTTDCDSDGLSSDDIESDADSEASSGATSAISVDIGKAKTLRHPLLCHPTKSRHDLRRLMDAPVSHETKILYTNPPSAKPTSKQPPVEPQLTAARSLDKCAGPAPGPTGISKLNTAYLAPHTHKIGSGNVTVLPSLSLLVDLREGERRKGRKGNEVLVISPDGGDVKVYNAPHLSTPCCLVEPAAQYGVDELPAAYRKQYETSLKVVNGLKARIPKLVLHRPEARFTMMANEPFGDVEIVSPPLESHAGSKAPDGLQTTRLRLLRASRAVEVSRYSSRGDNKAAGEWTKQAFPILGHGFEVKIPAEACDGLDDAVAGALKMLRSFLKLRKLVEEHDSGSAEAPFASTRPGSVSWSGAPGSEGSVMATPTSCIVNPLAQQTYLRSRTLADKTHTTTLPSSTIAVNGRASADVSAATATTTSTVASVRIPPRPRKLNARPVSGSSVACSDSNVARW